MGRLDVLMQLEVGEEIKCLSGSGVLRLSAGGVPIEHQCSQGPRKVQVADRQGLPARWLKSLLGLGVKRPPTKWAGIARGSRPQEAIVRIIKDRIDLTDALSSFSSPPSRVLLEFASDQRVLYERTTSRDRGRVFVSGAFPSGLYWLKSLDPSVGSVALVYLPADRSYGDARRRFAEILKLTATWPTEDARNFRAYCLLALSEEHSGY